jgi:hypothetical protein
MMKKLLNIFLVAIFLVGLVAPAAFADATSVPRISGLTDVTVDAGDEVYVDLIVDDEDGDRTSLTVSAEPQVSGVNLQQVDNTNYVFTWTTASTDAGIYKFSFEVCDSYGACDTGNMYVTVLNVDMPVDYQAIYENYEVTLSNYQEEYDNEVIPMYQEAMCFGDEETIENTVNMIEEGIVNLLGFVDPLDTFSDEADDVGQDAAALNLNNLASDFASLAHDAEALITEPFDDSVVCEEPVFVDADGDRVVDSEDNCPNDANPDQADADNDGTGDVCELSDVEDADADGIVDSLDNCPIVANADQLDTDVDLIGDVCDLDDDADGIVDTLDNCPLVANADQLDTDADLIGDVCDAGDTPVDPVTYKDQYNDLKDEYEAFEDDYQYNKKKYNNAVEDNDEDDIEKYQDRLEELDDDLKDLDDDVESLIDDIESEDNVDENLVDDLDELEDDVENLREKIDNVLNDDDTNTGYVYESTYVPPKSTSSEPAVVVEQLDFSNLNPANSEPVNSAWDNMRYLVWLIAGIVVLIAVLLFFLALLLG